MKKYIITLLILAPLTASAFSLNPLDWFGVKFGATVLTVPQGGTGASTFTAGECLKGNGTGAITTGSCGTGGSSFAWPFTVNTGYNSTSTVIGFNGLFSTASSTFSSNLYLSSLSQGFLNVGSNGLVYTTSTSTALATKQDVLVSGTNIKTINGSSVLGSGDLTVVGATALASSTPWTFGSLVVAKDNGSVTTISTSTLKTSQLTNDAGFTTFAWPFTVNTGYNSTSTVLGLNGFFSTASSTVSGNFYLPALTQGFAYVGSSGKVNTVASSSILLSDLGGSVTDSQVPDTITINLAGTATALAGNGANCSSGNAPLGVDASGAVENCFDVWTEAENTSAAYISDGNTNWDNSYGFTTFAWPFTPVSTGVVSTTSQINMAGFLSTASSTIVGNATTTGSHGAGAIYVNGDYITDFTGTNLSVTNGVLSAAGGSGSSKWATSTIDSTAISPAGAAKVGIGTTTPYLSLSIVGGIFANDLWGSGDTLASLYPGSGDRSIFYWYPKKGAFGAFERDTGTLTPSDIGGSSALFGYNNVASGYASFSAGRGNTSSGDYSFSIGNNDNTGNTASGLSSIAIGSGNEATSTNSIAIGLNNLVGTQANGIAIGNSNTVLHADAWAIGDSNTVGASADDTLALGAVNIVLGSDSYAIGRDISLSGITSLALGQYLSSQTNNSIVIGQGVNGASTLSNDQAKSIYLGIDSTIPTLVLTDSGGAGKVGKVGIGTTTPAWLTQISSVDTVKPFLALSDQSAGTDLKHWTFSSQGGNLYIATSTDQYSTSTVSALSIGTNGKVRANCFTMDGTNCLTAGTGILSYDAWTHPAAGQSATTSQINLAGFLSTASSTIVGNATTTGSHGMGALFLGGSQYLTSLTGTGLALTSGTLSATLGTTVAPNELVNQANTIGNAILALDSTKSNFISTGTVQWLTVPAINSTTTNFSIFSGGIGIGTSTPWLNSLLNVAGTTTVKGQLVSLAASTTASATQTIDWSTGNTQKIMLTANTNIVVNSTSSNPIDGGKYTLRICQDPTGSRTLTWANPVNLRWWNGTTTISSAANKCTFIGMIYTSENGNSIYSVVASSTGIDIK